MKYLKRLIIYGWKYCLISLCLFIVLWQIYSIWVQLGYVSEKFESSSIKNSSKILSAYDKNDLFTLRNLLLELKEQEIKKITFRPENPHPIFKNIVVGEINNENLTWDLRRSFHVEIEGISLGTIEYTINLVSFSNWVFYKNLPLFFTVMIVLLLLILLSNLGNIKVLARIEDGIAELSAISEKELNLMMVENLTNRLKRIPTNRVSKTYTDFLRKLISIFSTIVNLEKKLKETERLAAIGQTTAMVAHDVRKPFASVKTFLQLLPKKHGDTEFIEMSRTQIDESLKRVESMLEEILDFTRTKPPQLNEANPQKMILTALEEAFRSIPNSDITFEYDLKHTHMNHIDVLKVTRALINLIDNAAQAMNHRGRIWIKTRDVVVHGKLFVEFTIGNHNGSDGPIIPAEYLDQLFEPFFTQGKKKGTGLGLAIVKKAVEMHGGKITVTSNAVTGTEFIFTLPALDLPAVVRENELVHHTRELVPSVAKPILNAPNHDRLSRLAMVKNYKESLGRKLNLLVVDDESIFRDSVRFLATSGNAIDDLITVAEACDGEQALAMLGAQRMDYMVIDIDLGH